MKLLFKQRLFSWFDSYDIYDEQGQTLFTVEGRPSWGHCLHILDAQKQHIGTVKEVLMSLKPRFELFCGDVCVGSICREITWLKPKFTMDVNGWTADGDWLGWNYSIRSADGDVVATASQEVLNWTDTYAIDIVNPDDVLPVLMVVLAIDAEKCHVY